MTFSCTACGKPHSPHQRQTVCRRCGAPLQADYHFAPGRITPDDLLTDHPTLWRYLPFLPAIPERARISLGEGHTDLLKREYQERIVYLKDETGNPTGSFKDRGLCLALSAARALRIKRIALPSAGNAAVSAATYALAGHLQCRVYLPESIPETFVREIHDSGAEVIIAGTTIAEAAAAMADQLDDSWFSISTLKEPYRVEGKKTMGLEISEQLDWDFPDVVVYPTGGGTGLIGIWKACRELQQLDWVRKAPPRMAAVQMEGCAPVVTAFHEGRDNTEPWPDPHTRALGLNVPTPLGGAWMLKVLRSSGGTALTVPEADLPGARDRLAEVSGLSPGPEAAAAWRGFERLVEDDWIREGERAVVVVTGDDRRYS